MRASVSSKVALYNEKFEGMVYSMYADWESLITTSIGCLVDRPQDVLKLPWKTRYGLAATPTEIAAEWRRIKAGTCGMSRLKSRKQCPRVQSGRVCFAHDGWRASETPDALKLLRADAEALVQQRAAGMWATLVKRFPGLVDAPADAQLGVLSWAWAMGAARTGWPKFFAAIQAKDWMACAKESQISTAGNAGVIPRNAAQSILFNNAAKVVASGLDPDALYWPRAL